MLFQLLEEDLGPGEWSILLAMQNELYAWVKNRLLFAKLNHLLSELAKFLS